VSEALYCPVEELENSRLVNLQVATLGTHLASQRKVKIKIRILQGAVKTFPEIFDTDGLVYRESVPPEQSVTVRVLQRKRRHKWQAGTVVSAPSHTLPSHHNFRITLPVTFACSLR
jgi:hypothetical protein